MSYPQFIWATVATIFLAISGWDEYSTEVELRRLKWIRWQTFMLSLELDPKKLHSPMDFFTLPDEDALYTGGGPITEEQYQAKLKQFEEAQHVFDKWDREMEKRYADTK